jgi:hypothetical protein
MQMRGTTTPMTNDKNWGFPEMEFFYFASKIKVFVYLERCRNQDYDKGEQ